MALHPLPHPSVPFVDPKTGLVQKDWYEYLRSIQTIGLSTLPDVSLTTLSNNQVLIWKSADLRWENGAN